MRLPKKQLFARGRLSSLLARRARARGGRRSPPTPLARAARAHLRKKEFEAKKFGPARWIDERQRLHDGRAVRRRRPTATDIVRYDAATGARQVLSPPRALVPAPGEKPLAIDDYAWSTDGKRLLIFTNTKKVWRQNTRGDYWVLDLASGKLQQARRRRARVVADVRQVLARRRRASPTCAPTTSTSRTSATGTITRADDRRLGDDHQRHLRLGLRGGARRARRLPLEPGRQAHRLLAVRHDAASATSR